MNKKDIVITIVVAIIVVIFGTLGFMLIKNHQKDQEANAPAETQPTTSTAISANDKVLVAYYSQTGTTAAIAEEIAAQTGADLLEIIPEVVYPTDYSEHRVIAQREKSEDARPALATHIENIEDYNTIFIGYPIWFYTAPMMIRTFVEEYDFTGKTIIPFCTSGGSAIAESVNDIRSLLPNVEVLDGQRFGNLSAEARRSEVGAWLNTLNLTNNSNGYNNMTTNQTRIKATVNGTELYAVLDDNAATRDFLAKLPITLPMQDLYDREMCYHFSEAFATDNLQSDNYEVGDIIYWPPRHSFVILYEQNGERFERQTLGHFESSVEIFKTTGDAEVKFELAE